ncbi:Plant invertase/pectin methylesterase inhibitor superfamily protein [Striga hermonthica]|uniref:Plant invertase/pectin methylesterase inhibitor superfamily protein n=1 Tax=Striga hermonthica TaxID=68872 RepID=A0A9N7RCJ1_STRHE|nr:Plant invertase/pectin methylesterase inhibitor superfamily protein [Striga hermonthica]
MSLYQLHESYSMVALLVFMSVLRFAVEAGGDYAKEALSVATNLVSKSDDITPELRSTLKDCKESYDVAVENFQKTLDAFTTKDVGTMRSVLSAVITFVGDCEDEFAEMQAPSPLSGYAEKLTDMTSNCLAIVSQMMN